MDKRVLIQVIGRVQGVFYRASTLKKAKYSGLKGWVQNQPDGSVKIDVEGEPHKVDEFVEWCKRGPENAVVEHMIEKELRELAGYEGFEIKR